MITLCPPEAWWKGEVYSALALPGPLLEVSKALVLQGPGSEKPTPKPKGMRRSGLEGQLSVALGAVSSRRPVAAGIGARPPTGVQLQNALVQVQPLSPQDRMPKAKSPP